LLRRIAADPAADLERLAAMVAFAVAIGNADLHGRNVSLLYGDEGPMLAPVYDAIATVAYEDITTDLGMSVGQARSVGSVSATDLVAEISSWGITRTRAARLLEEDLDRLDAAIDHATDAVPAAHAVADIVRGRLAKLRSTA
jgi:serine/threonine-protein kinase HipA